MSLSDLWSWDASAASCFGSGLRWSPFELGRLFANQHSMNLGFTTQKLEQRWQQLTHHRLQWVAIWPDDFPDLFFFKSWNPPVPPVMEDHALIFESSEALVAVVFDPAKSKIGTVNFWGLSALTVSSPRNLKIFFTWKDVEVLRSFHAMGLKEEILRGIFAYGFEKCHRRPLFRVVLPFSRYGNKQMILRWIEWMLNGA